MLTKKQLELVLKTIGRIKNPNYERVRDSVQLNQEFFDEDGNLPQNLLTVEQVIEIHKIALTVGNKDEAVTLILEAQKESPEAGVSEKREDATEPAQEAGSISNTAMAKAEKIRETRLKQAEKATEIKRAQEEVKRAQEEEFSQLSNAVNIYSKIYDYTVVRKKYEFEIKTEVKRLMQEGWVPYGGVSYASAGASPIGDIGNTFIQAMVKIKN